MDGANQAIPSGSEYVASSASSVPNLDQAVSEANSEDLLEWSPSPRASPIPAIASLDLPYAGEFSTLLDLSDDSPAINGLDPHPVDVDRWELVISPAEYLLRFKDTLATVQLISRAPLRRLHTTYHRGPGFDRWLLLAQANHQLWVDPRFKDPFFMHLDQYQVAQPGQIPLQASQGNVHLSTSVFIHCLSAAGCDTIRLKAYGQKTPINQRFLAREPAEIDHRWAIHNEWDIGCTFGSPYVWLFAGKDGRQHGMEHYSMLVPGSGNFGTVNIKAVHCGRHFKIKMYPRLVHLIKSFNSRLQGSIPKTLQGVRNQAASALRMIHNLTSKDENAIGGFRIEVTVKAKTLQEAHRLVNATNFLDPGHWLQTDEGTSARKGVDAMLVTREGLLANANWVYDQAAQANVFIGAASDKPSKEQVQAIVDILNALGWNAGIRRPTKSLDPDAWWHLMPSSDRAKVFRELVEKYQTDGDIKNLFALAKESAEYNALPCKADPGNPSHRYQIHGRTPFRVRCSSGGCRSKLQRSALVHWIAELVQSGVVDRSNLGL